MNKLILLYINFYYVPLSSFIIAHIFLAVFLISVPSQSPVGSLSPGKASHCPSITQLFPNLFEFSFLFSSCGMTRDINKLYVKRLEPPLHPSPSTVFENTVMATLNAPQTAANDSRLFLLTVGNHNAARVKKTRGPLINMSVQICTLTTNNQNANTC